MTGLADAEAVVARKAAGVEPNPSDELLVLAGLFLGLAWTLYVEWWRRWWL